MTEGSLLLNQRYPTNRTFEHYPDKKRVLEDSYFPFAIKRWDALPGSVRSLDQADFKLKLKEVLKPPGFNTSTVDTKC